MQDGSKNLRHGGENVRHGAKNVRHSIENMLHGDKKLRHGAKMCVMVPKMCDMVLKMPTMSGRSTMVLGRYTDPDRPTNGRYCTNNRQRTNNTPNIGPLQIFNQGGNWKSGVWQFELINVNIILGNAQTLILTSEKAKKSRVKKQVRKMSKDKDIRVSQHEASLELNRGRKGSVEEEEREEVTSFLLLLGSIRQRAALHELGLLVQPETLRLLQAVTSLALHPSPPCWPGSAPGTPSISAPAGSGGKAGRAPPPPPSALCCCGARVCNTVSLPAAGQGQAGPGQPRQEGRQNAAIVCIGVTYGLSVAS